MKKKLYTLSIYRNCELQLKINHQNIILSAARCRKALASTASSNDNAFEKKIKTTAYFNVTVLNFLSSQSYPQSRVNCMLLQFHVFARTVKNVFQKLHALKKWIKHYAARNFYLSRIFSQKKNTNKNIDDNKLEMPTWTLTSQSF